MLASTHSWSGEKLLCSTLKPPCHSFGVILGQRTWLSGLFQSCPSVWVINCVPTVKTIILLWKASVIVMLDDQWKNTHRNLLIVSYENESQVERTEAVGYIRWLKGKVAVESGGRGSKQTDKNVTAFGELRVWKLNFNQSKFMVSFWKWYTHLTSCDWGVKILVEVGGKRLAMAWWDPMINDLLLRCELCRILRLIGCPTLGERSIESWPASPHLQDSCLTVRLDRQGWY